MVQKGSKHLGVDDDDDDDDNDDDDNNNNNNNNKHVECKNKGDTCNNKRDWDYFKF